MKGEWNPIWIKTGATPEMIEFTENNAKAMFPNEKRNQLTASKVRNIYGEIKRIQMGGYDKNIASFLLLRPKMAYAYGRDNTNEGLRLFKEIFDMAHKEVENKEQFENFCNLFEAIIAYHKAHGGK